MTGFVFDMDGTLLHSIHLWLEAEQAILDEAGIKLTKEERDEVNTLTLDEVGVWFHERFGIMGNGAEVAQAVVDRMLVFYRTKVQVNPGVVDFVQAVHDAGAPMCVLSSSPQAFIEAGLEHTNLKRFFDDDLVISSEATGMIKRSPATFDRICEMLGTNSSDTWLFDDSWYALATARDKGLRCVGTFSDDGCGTHEELARYSELVIDSFVGLNPADFL